MAGPEFKQKEDAVFNFTKEIQVRSTKIPTEVSKVTVRAALTVKLHLLPLRTHVLRNLRLPTVDHHQPV